MGDGVAKMSSETLQKLSTPGMLTILSYFMCKHLFARTLVSVSTMVLILGKISL